MQKLARHRAVRLPNGDAYKHMIMSEEEIEARRKYIRMTLSHYETKIPPWFKFDNASIDMARLEADDDLYLLDVWDDKVKRSYEHIIERAEWDRKGEKNGN